MPKVPAKPSRTAESVVKRRQAVADFLREKYGDAITSESIADAANKFNMTVQSVRNYMRHCGIPIPRPSSSHLDGNSITRAFVIAKLRREGKSIADIAADTGVSKQRVSIIVQQAFESGILAVDATITDPTLAPQGTTSTAAAKLPYQALAMRMGGDSESAIADGLRINPKTIKFWLKQAKLLGLVG